MALAVNADVGGRNLFNHPIPGVLEFIGLSIVAVVFLQMANTLREGRHVSNDILMRIVAEARPRLASALYALFHLIGAMLMALIVWFVWPILVEQLSRRLLPGHRRRGRDPHLAIHRRGDRRRGRDRRAVPDRWHGTSPRPAARRRIRPR